MLCVTKQHALLFPALALDRGGILLAAPPGRPGEGINPLLMRILMKKGRDEMQIVLHGCGQLAEQLRQRGYEVVEEGTAADAVLYGETEIPDLPVCGGGALLVPVKNKSLDEVDRILQTRLYHPLFEEQKYF